MVTHQRLHQIESNWRVCSLEIVKFINFHEKHSDSCGMISSNRLPVDTSWTLQFQCVFMWILLEFQYSLVFSHKWHLHHWIWSIIQTSLNRCCHFVVQNYTVHFEVVLIISNQNHFQYIHMEGSLLYQIITRVLEKHQDCEKRLSFISRHLLKASSPHETAV